jgi:hypothetical protein
MALAPGVVSVTSSYLLSVLELIAVFNSAQYAVPKLVHVISITRADALMLIFLFKCIQSQLRGNYAFISNKYLLWLKTRVERLSHFRPLGKLLVLRQSRR